MVIDKSTGSKIQLASGILGPLIIIIIGVRRRY
jgi:hypothetical protein